jgi:hypothetical protein
VAAPLLLPVVDLLVVVVGRLQLVEAGAARPLTAVGSEVVGVVGIVGGQLVAVLRHAPRGTPVGPRR